MTLFNPFNTYYCVYIVCSQVQFGIAADPAVTAEWDETIPDDPVLQSNLESYVTFATAGADTRTTQLFINYINNTGLDDQGFAPFAKGI